MRLRWVLTIAGAAFLLLGLMSELLPGGAPGFGLMQKVLLGLGGLLLATGALGRRTPAVYRGAAVMALNTLLLVLVVELTAGIALRLLPDGSEEDGRAVPYYAGQPWGAEYVQEYTAIHGRKMYQPYVIWRTPPFRGRQINVDEHGIRRTVGPECGSDSYRVFTFGGSTMWGVGSPDWGTIPSYLVTEFEARLKRPLCVTNFGEHGFVSTQSVVQLVRELDAGNVPDLVIFYDGINDVFSTVQAGEAGVHYELSSIKAKFEGTEPRGAAWLRRRNTYRLLARLSPPPPAPQPARGPDAVNGTVRVYVNNHRIVATLAQAYGFDYHFFWQPNLVVSGKRQTASEQQMRARLDPDVASFITTVYGLVHREAAHRDHIHDISDALDHETAPLYIDWMHLTPEGNRVVARAIASRFGEAASTE